MNIIKSYIVTNAAAAGGGSGSVTSFSSGNLSPLFTTSVATATTTPALSFTAVNQNANLVYAGPATGPAAAPTFRALVAADIPALPYATVNGHVIENSGTPLTQRANLNFTNGLTSSDNTPDTDVRLGGTTTNLSLSGTVTAIGLEVIPSGNFQVYTSGGSPVISLGISNTGVEPGIVMGGDPTPANSFLSLRSAWLDDFGDSWRFDFRISSATWTRGSVNSALPAYASNYSANYTDRTWVDRGYVLGAKTYTGVQTFSLTSLYANNAGIDVVATGGSDILNIGTSNADVINIGYSGSTINITGTLAYQNVTNLQVTDKLFTVNKGGGAGSGVSSGFEIEENAIITGYFATNGTRDGWDFKAPAITGVANLSLASLTGNHTYTLPDANGTFAVSASGNIALSAAGNITLTGIVGPANGGTGIANNAASTLTISGNFATTLTVTGVTGVTLPTTGTLATLAGIETLTDKTLGTGTIFSVIPTINDGITFTFNPSATLSGLNVGAITGNPSTIVDGNIWYNSTANSFNLHKAGVIEGLATAATVVANRIPFWLNTARTLQDSANLTFTTNRLSGTTLYLTLSAGTATAGTCPLVMTSGTNLTVAISGGIEYNNTFHMTNSDATRRHVVLAASATKTTAGAPYSNDGFVTLNIGGTDVKFMTTA